MQPAKKASRVTQQNTAMDISFVKKFWNLTELPIATKLSVVVAAHLEVIRVVLLDASKPLRMPRLPSDGGGELVVQAGGHPDCDYAQYIGPDYKVPQQIATRILSLKARQGAERPPSAPLSRARPLHPPSPRAAKGSFGSEASPWPTSPRPHAASPLPCVPSHNRVSFPSLT